MGKTKNRNKPNRNSNTINTNKQNPTDLREASSSVGTASSSDVDGSSSLSRRTHAGTSQPSTVSDAASVISPKLPSHVEKRDSVISGEWESSEKRRKSQTKLVSRSRWRPRPGNWWPCRIYRQICGFTIALVRAAQGPRQADVLLTLCLAALVMFAGYIAIGLLSSMLKVVAAQDTAVDADCSVVYVTVPGPIITVSLINASPSDPARGTYYFSVVNGTTEWMNSIAPPSRFSTLVTRTPMVTPAISSLPTAPTVGFTSVTSAANSAPVVPPLVPIPPLPAKTVTATFLSGTTLITTVITSSPSAGLYLPLSSTSLQNTAPSIPSGQLGQPPRPWPSASGLPGSLTSTTTPALPGFPDSSLLRPTQSIGTSGGISLDSSSTALETTSRSTTPGIPAPGSPSISMGPFTSSMPVTVTSVASNGLTTVFTRTMPAVVSGTPSPPLNNPAASSTSTFLVVLTSTAPNGPTTVLTSTSTTILVDSSAPSSAAPLIPGASSAVGIPFLPSSASPPQGAPPSVIPSGQTSLLSSNAVSAISSLATASASGLLPSAPGTIAASSPTSTVQTQSIGTAAPPFNRPSSLSNPGVPTGSLATPSTSMQVPPGPTVTVALSSSISVPDSPSSLASPSAATSSLSIPGPSPSMTGTAPGTPILSPSNLPSTSMSVASSTTASSVPASSSAPGAPSSPAMTMNPVTSAVNLTLSTVPTPGLPSLISSMSPQNSTAGSTSASSSSSAAASGFPVASAPTTFRTLTPPANMSTSSSSQLGSSSLSSSLASSSSSSITPPLASSFAWPSDSMSTLPSSMTLTSMTSVTSSGSALTGPAIGTLPSSTTLTSLTSVTSSSGSAPTEPAIGTLPSLTTLTSLTSVTSSSGSAPTEPAIGTLPSSTTLTSLTFVTSSGSAPTEPAIGTLPSSTTLTSLTFVTSSGSAPAGPASSTDGDFFARGSMTRVISFGDQGFSFVFPTPDITTTMSYWTGSYPTVSGPLPSDLQTASPTTRSTTQTPLSAPPPFSSASQRPRFRTVITTIFEDGPEQGFAKRAEATSAVQVVLSTVTPQGMSAVPDFSAVEAPGPTSCGESGKFVLNFDDTVVPNTDQVLNADGLINPYHHLFYANGYTDVPDKWEPYPAISQPNIAMFLPLTGKILANQPFSGTLLPGEIGAGPRAAVDAYWFNAYSGYFGCALNGLTPCVLRISGYRYDAVLKSEVLVAQQKATLPACYGYINCQLTQIQFNEDFQALSGIQFNAYTANLGLPQVHMMDDLALEWYNNTCSAGILRIGHQ